MTSVVLRACNLAFLPVQDFDDRSADFLDHIILPRNLFNSWAPLWDSTLMMVSIQKCGGIEKRLCCVGSCHTEDPDNVYASMWILEYLGMGETDMFAIVEPVFETFPRVKKLTLQPFDNEVFYGDLRTHFQDALNRFTMIQKGDVVVVPIPELDDFEARVMIRDMAAEDGKEIEGVALFGGEVEVEFYGDSDVNGGSDESSAAPVHVPVATSDAFVGIGESVMGTLSSVHTPSETMATKVLEESEESESTEDTTATVRASWIARFKKSSS